MATKPIRIGEAVYERLEARKREGETVSDVIDRLIEESSTDWRDGFGTLPDGAAADLEAATERARDDPESH